MPGWGESNETDNSTAYNSSQILYRIVTSRTTNVKFLHHSTNQRSHTTKGEEREREKGASEPAKI